MKRRFLKVFDLFHDPQFLRKFHGWATIIWFMLAFPICIFLSESIAVVVFISVYANVVGHWSSWQASRVEVKEDEKNGNDQ